MLSANEDYELAITQMMQLLSQAGLQVMRTFDLSSACEDGHGICDHHVSTACDCRLTVLIVSGHNTTTTVTIHRCDGRIWLSLTDEPQRLMDEDMEASITSVVALVQCGVQHLKNVL
jgi:hypothetical protein